MTLTASCLEVFMDPKYFAPMDCTKPMLRVNMPMGSLPKLTSIEKEYWVKGIYLATIDTAELSPLIMLTAKTLAQLFWQSLALLIKA